LIYQSFTIREVKCMYVQIVLATSKEFSQLVW